MFCKSCGRRVDDDSKYCIHCGTKLFFNKMPETENDEKAIDVPDSSKTEKEINLSSAPKKIVSQKHAITSFNQQDVLGEFALSAKKKPDLRKLIAFIIAFLGCLILASYISFLLLTEIPVIPEIDLIKFWGLIWFSQTFGIHIFAIYGFLLLLVSSILLLKSNRDIFYKILSIGIDGIGLLLFMALFQNVFFGKNIDALKEYFNLSYYLQFNLFANKIFVWSLYLFLFYFVFELSGGTLGKRIVGLVSHNNEYQNITLIQGLKKTIIYAIPIWLILLSFLWNVQILNNITNSIFYHFCQWICFMLFFISLFMIFISKENQSLADFFSKTMVVMKNNQSFLLNVTNHDDTSSKSLEGSDALFEKISSLNKLIVSEKRKFFSSNNKLIIERIEEIVKDNKSFFLINKIYKEHYSTGLQEHLMSISSGYGTIYYYMKPFIKLGVCEEDFPHKIISFE